MSGRCATCRWWIGYDSQVGPTDAGCSILSDFKHMQRRMNVSNVQLSVDGAFADGGSEFYCGPAFFCGHYEAATDESLEKRMRDAYVMRRTWMRDVQNESIRFAIDMLVAQTIELCAAQFSADGLRDINARIRGSESTAGKEVDG